MKITLLEHQPYRIKKEGEASAFFEALPEVCPYVLKKDQWGMPVYPYEIWRKEKSVCKRAIMWVFYGW